MIARFRTTPLRWSILAAAVTIGLAIVALTDARSQQTPREWSRAFVNDPELVIADEPTGNLDSSTGKKIMEILINLHQEEKKTIIVVTHDPTIANYSNQIVNIKDGQLVANHLVGEKVLWANKR